MAWISKRFRRAGRRGASTKSTRRFCERRLLLPQMRQRVSLRPETVEALESLAKRAHFGG